MSARGLLAARRADLRGLGGSDAGRNLVARVIALAALTLASLMVARTLGPAGIGALSLLRVLPWLVGVILGGGLYGAAPFFLSGPRREDAAFRATFPAMAVTAGVVGTWLWVLAAPALKASLFPQMGTAVVMLAGATVLTQLLETTSKACSQGRGDLPGANRIIVLEEAMFLPLYAGMLLAGVSPYTAMVASLIAGDLITASLGWLRLRARGFFTGSRPDLRHAWRIVVFGIRAEVGSVVLLLNARLDFAIVGVLVGPSALGVYAVASRYSELLRLPGLAMNYVLYPAYARAGGASAARDAREAIRRMGWVPAAAAVPMAVAAPVVLPLFYGQAFHLAVVPAWILLVGLCGSGVSGIIAAFLSGDGRPGLASTALGAGLVVTVGGDLWLIPRHGIVGASIASCLAYLTTTLVLLFCFRAVTKAETRPTAAGLDATEARAAGRLREPRGGREARTSRGRRRPTRAVRRPGSTDPAAVPAGSVEPARGKSHVRPGREPPLGKRLFDVVVAGTTVVLVSPLMAVIALAIKLRSPGPVFFRQVRVGQGGRTFVLLKFRTMVVGADQMAANVSAEGDPRVTGVGRHLRAWYLDELPQLINVVRGDMSLVGPRPETPEFVALMDHDERRLLTVCGGLAGPSTLAFMDEAVMLAGAEDPETYYTATLLHSRAQVDLSYLELRSFRYDVSLLVRQALAILGRNR